jgi:hypothetical protein
MYTYAHPLVSATLLIVTCTVLFANTLIERRQQAEAFPVYKPRPSLAESRRHDMLVGNWIGESPVKDGGRREVLLERRADGTFTVTFRTHWGTDHAVVERQVGQWGISGPVYFTITTGWLDGDHVDPTDLGQPYYYDAYRIVDLSEDEFEFESFTTDTHYVLHRVPEGHTPSDR